eukprot:TRINITY_DN5588_c0_g1_i1.p1 TRINITY_DN5588_c0_g1~~TRINITY_DN5588_c0_g1_i1.p1  ORF type:complete len:102 (+),score=23.53 TRINITY_DN5588_c0_g1_i1:48-353(+)
MVRLETVIKKLTSILFFVCLTHRLFKTLDKDKSGVLENAEYKTFIDEAAKYMLSDLTKAGHDYDDSTIRDWLKTWLDPNGDGKITRDELKANLKAVLDAGE